MPQKDSPPQSHEALWSVPNNFTQPQESRVLYVARLQRVPTYGN
jgi:hypothetical protein